MSAKKAWDSSDWIERLNIEARTCNQFTQDEDSLLPDLCICNRWKEEHEEDNIITMLLRELQQFASGSAPQTSRNVKKIEETESAFKAHTETIETNAYGLLESSNAPYIRCDIETHPDTLALIMLDLWKMNKPQLIMSISGGFRSTLKVQFQKEFIEGITDAALASDAWIMTNGYKDEVVPRLVGEVVYKNKLKNLRDVDKNEQKHINAIGVGKWANIKHRNELIRPEYR
ncbi:unnamed protein product, partial [Didymodactylos carnosus]